MEDAVPLPTALSRKEPEQARTIVPAILTAFCAGTANDMALASLHQAGRRQGLRAQALVGEAGRSR
jgi:hypothetical protein